MFPLTLGSLPSIPPFLTTFSPHRGHAGSSTNLPFSLQETAQLSTSSSLSLSHTHTKATTHTQKEIRVYCGAICEWLWPKNMDSVCSEKSRSTVEVVYGILLVTEQSHIWRHLLKALVGTGRQVSEKQGKLLYTFQNYLVTCLASRFMEASGLWRRHFQDFDRHRSG